MSKKILVPLGQYDRSEEMIPYIENVARPGMQVVFLVRYPVDGFLWPKEEFGMKAALEAKKLVTHYSWEENLRRAANRISHASEILGCKGIEVTVDVYAGGLNKAVRSHTINGDVHLIMRRVGIGQRVAAFLNGAVAVSRLFKRPSFSAVQLIHPSTVV